MIKEFTPDHRTNFFIPFSITLERVVQITKQTPKEAVDKVAEAIKAETEVQEEQQSYRVKAGDTLSKIAKNHYGDANAWDKIYQANQDSLQSPHKIQIGQELKLP